MKKNLISLLLSILILLVSVGLLSFFVKGRPSENGLAYQYDYRTEVGGPFESSNTNSRYMLTETIAKEGRYLFDEREARFSAPDVVYYRERFFSIFTPGVSILAVPFYWLGSYFNAPQLFSFFTTILFAVMNVFMVSRLASRFGANRFLSYGLGLSFLFASNALAYSLTLTQHHYSVTVLLLAILNALARKRTYLNNLAFGFIFMSGILFDIPNAFMMLPIAFYIFFKHFEITKTAKTIKLFINPLGIFVVIAMLPLLFFFMDYNKQTSGNPTTIGQNIGQTDYFDSEEKKQERKLKKLQDTYETVNTPFNTRKQLSGFYTLIVSDERGIFYYNALVIVGILGLIMAYRKHQELVSLVTSVILVNIVLYSAFGDAWGGWSFGPRYLIPSVALLIAGIAGLVSLSKKWKYAVLVLFMITLLYSTYINIAGALTTNAIPPKVEALQLDDPLPYTYKLNFDLIKENKSSSLLYNNMLTNQIPLEMFHLYLFLGISSLILVLFSVGFLKKGEER